MQNDEWRLLQEYRRSRSDLLFERLTTPHLKLVYSTCLREVHDPYLAEDVAQAVLLIFVRKIDTIRPDTRLAGWFYLTAKLASRNALKQEARRRQLERQVAQETLMDAAPNRERESAEPWINAALDRLGSADREAVLLHYVEGRSMQEVGAALGVSQDAAKMRVFRAINRLRKHLARKDVLITSAALAAVLLADGSPARAYAMEAHNGAHGSGQPPERASQIAFSTMLTVKRARRATAICAVFCGLIVITGTAFLATKSITPGANPLSKQAVVLKTGDVKVAANAGSAATVDLNKPLVLLDKELVGDYYVCPLCKCYYTPDLAGRIGYNEGAPDFHQLVHVRTVPAGYFKFLPEYLGIVDKAVAAAQSARASRPGGGG